MDAADEADQVARCVVTLLRHLTALTPDNGIHLLALIAQVQDLYELER